MKKRILSLVLCAAMLLSMCLFLGAGVAGDAPATEDFVPAVNFTNVAPLVQANAQAANGPARAPLRATNANGGSTTPTDPPKGKDTAGLVTSKTATANKDGTYTITLTSYTTGTVTEQTTTKPTDIVLVLDQSGSMAYDMGSEKVTVYTKVESSNITNYRNRANRYVKLSNGAYAPVTITESKSGGWWDTTYTYTYTYMDENDQRRSATSEGQYTTFDEWQLYFQETRVLSRLEALQNAVTNFVDQVSKEATENKVDHRIAIVGFASTNEQNYYNNTELLSTSKVVNYGSAQEKDYKDALVSVNGANGKINSRLTTAIDRLDADGDTYSEYGIDMANRIFAQHSTGSEADRQRVVVVFTDGYTAPSGTDAFKYSMANAAIDKAHVSKNDYKATVYTIGIFANANPTADIESNFKASDGWHEASWNENAGNTLTSAQELVAANRYMHYVSSNYPNAKSLNNGGDLSDKANPFNGGDSYYLSAGDADSLTGIFAKISDNISTPSINLGKQAYVQDTVSDYFAAPADGTVTVTTEKAYYENGNLQWETDDNPPAGLTHTVTGKTVKVSGFDYDANFVSETGRDETDSKKPGDFHGRRLVVTFTVKAEPGFLGGNNVPTNDATSGVYDEKGTLVENFDYPRVNVPITTPELTPKDANVYYGGAVPTAGELCTTGAIGEKMADYVDITYSVDGSTVSNTTDDTYQVTMTVSPKYSGANANGDVQKAQTKNVTSTVNVYKPEVTFKDSIIDYNATPNYEDNLGGVVWKHKDTVANTANMTGTEPTLAYTYDPAESALTQDTGVKVTVKIGNQDITGAVVFEHEKCSFSNCKYTDDCGYQFYVHINVFDLTIKKTAADGSEPIDKDQTFVFKVTNTNTGKTMEVVITGAGQKTIKNLPVGNYTITEDTGWSWKYTPKNNNLSVTDEDIRDGTATVTFENENKGTNWLTSLAKALNVWKDNGTTVTRDPKN